MAAISRPLGQLVYGVAVLLLISGARSSEDVLLGYDCSQPKSLFKAKLSEVLPSCGDAQNVDIQTVAATLIKRIPKNKSVVVDQCNVWYESSSSSESFIAGLHNPRKQETLGRAACVEAVRTRILTLHGQRIRGLVTHERVRQRLSVDSPDSACSLLPSRGRFECEKVSRDYDISLKASVGEASLQENVIRLAGGVTCNYTDFGCTDDRQGEFYWEAVDDNSECDRDSFAAVYTGKVSVVTSKVSLSRFEVKYVEAQWEDKRLAVRIVAKVSICGQDAYSTENPSLFLLLNESGIYEKREFIEEGLFYNETASEKRCKIETSAFVERMQVLNANPNRFTEDFEAGVVGTVSRGTVYVNQCKSVAVKTRQTKETYNETAVVDDSGREWFLSPDSKILVNSADPVESASTIADLLGAIVAQLKIYHEWYEFIGTCFQFVWGFAVLFRIYKFVVGIICRFLPASARSLFGDEVVVGEDGVARRRYWRWLLNQLDRI